MLFQTIVWILVVWLAFASNGVRGQELVVGPNLRLGEDPEEILVSNPHQAEPHAVRSPVDENVLLVTFQEARQVAGGALTCGVAVSRDGGESWERRLLPALASVNGGPYFFATDPVGAIGSDGTFYLNTLVATDANFDGGAVVLQVSRDNGLTWSAPREVYRPLPGSGLFPDKNWMAVNSFENTPTSGRVVVSFTLFGEGNPIVSTFSDDDGETWAPLQTVTGVEVDAQGSQPLFLPDGRLVLVYFVFTEEWPVNGRLEIALSSKGGESWDTRKPIVPFSLYFDDFLRHGSFLPSATVDPASGRIHVVYGGAAGDDGQVYHVFSDDEGDTWSVPAVVNDSVRRNASVTPTVAVSDDGRYVAVSFYDKRNGPGATPRLTSSLDLYLAPSFDGGLTWGSDRRVTSVTIDASQAQISPRRGGELFMLGDYLGLTAPMAVGEVHFPVWVDTRDGQADPYTAAVRAWPESNDWALPDAEAVGEGWFYSEFFGFFWVRRMPWLYQATLGWVLSDGDRQSLWLYSPEDGWYWTSERFTPFAYRATDGEWIVFAGAGG